MVRLGVGDSGMTRQRRLLGWKAICGYLQCSRATAQRWRKNYALPIHETRTHRVWARPGELDEWRGDNVTPALPE